MWPLQKAEKEFRWQKGLVSVAKKSNDNASNDVISLRRRVIVTSTCATELLSSASAASGQIIRATARLRQTRDTIST